MEDLYSLLLQLGSILDGKNLLKVDDFDVEKSINGNEVTITITTKDKVKEFYDFIDQLDDDVFEAINEECAKTYPSILQKLKEGVKNTPEHLKMIENYKSLLPKAISNLIQKYQKEVKELESKIKSLTDYLTE